MYKKAIYEYDDDNKLVNSGKCAVYDDNGNFLRNETFEGEVYTGTFRAPNNEKQNDIVYDDTALVGQLNLYSIPLTKLIRTRNEHQANNE